MDDRRIIDITEYLGASPPGNDRFFAVWGGEGERARLALPMWRAVYLLAGDRAGIFWLPGEGKGDPQPFFVLDLGKDPARTTFSGISLDRLTGKAVPSVAASRTGGVVVLLGEEDGKRWFLGVQGGEAGSRLEGKVKDELLFLAGECAGLLFFRELAKGVG